MSAVPRQDSKSRDNHQEDKKPQENSRQSLKTVKKASQSCLNAQLSSYPNFLPVQERHARYII